MYWCLILNSAINIVIIIIVLIKKKFCLIIYIVIDVTSKYLFQHLNHFFYLIVNLWVKKFKCFSFISNVCVSIFQ